MEQIRGVDSCEDDGERRLICAILLQAIKDSIGMSRETYSEREMALLWLHTEKAHQYAEIVGLGDVWPPSYEMLIEWSKNQKVTL